jgi:hypothetical protein
MALKHSYNTESIRHCYQWNYRYTATSVKRIHTQSKESSVMLQKYWNTTGKQHGKTGSSLRVRYAASTGKQLPTYWATVSDITFRAKHSTSFKTSVPIYQSPQHNNPEGLNLQQYHYTNLISHIVQYLPYIQTYAYIQDLLLLLHQAWQL